MLNSSRRVPTYGFGALLGFVACGGAGERTPPVTPAPSAVASADKVSSNAAASPKFAVYVGLGDFSDDPKGSVRVYSFDQATAALQLQQDLKVGHLATYLAIAPNQRTLYLADEATHHLYCFRIAPNSGTLTPLCRVDCHGNPVYLTVDAPGKTLLTTFYNQGQTQAFALNEDGSIGAATDLEASGRRSHAVVLDRDSHFAYVPALEDDWIAQYRFDSENHQLTPNPDAQNFANIGPKGAGPRHFQFDPQNRFGYLVNELALSVSTYELDPKTGLLRAAHPPTSTLESSAEKPQDAAAADIHVHPNGRFLYTSNRMGEKSSISLFSLAPETGKPTLVAEESTRGSTPRNFKVSPDGRHLLVANQDSKNLVAFALDSSSGKLSYLATTALPEKPYFVGFGRF
ncbi:MAG: beta-propeller fold lactonase family protein [Polyangiaceae bacterium]|nr:beta-propeller fold lactonase family protein [Polyangiaceae bacterium]